MCDLGGRGFDQQKNQLTDMNSHTTLWGLWREQSAIRLLGPGSPAAIVGANDVVERTQVLASDALPHVVTGGIANLRMVVVDRQQLLGLLGLLGLRLRLLPLLVLGSRRARQINGNRPRRGDFRRRLRGNPPDELVCAGRLGTRSTRTRGRRSVHCSGRNRGRRSASTHRNARTPERRRPKLGAGVWLGLLRVLALLRARLGRCAKPFGGGDRSRGVLTSGAWSLGSVVTALVLPLGGLGGDCSRGFFVSGAFSWALGLVLV